MTIIITNDSCLHKSALYCAIMCTSTGRIVESDVGRLYVKLDDAQPSRLMAFQLDAARPSTDHA